jgi:hypothetical protein
LLLYVTVDLGDRRSVPIKAIQPKAVLPRLFEPVEFLLATSENPRYAVRRGFFSPPYGVPVRAYD